jgi:DNA primase
VKHGWRGNQPLTAHAQERRATVNHVPPRPSSPYPENIDVERLKESVNLSDVVRRYSELRPSGRTRVGLCPFHADSRPSFVVNDDLGLFYCHGCGVGGDVINFVRRIENCSFIEAIRSIAGAIPAITIPREREKARKLDRAKRALASAYARIQWNDAIAAKGTLAEIYLRGRGITCPIPSTLRYGVFPLWISLVTGRTGPRLPALIAACQSENGRVVGIQKIFLRRDGTRALLPRPKLSLGAIKGGALRLGPVAEQIIVCEGPEDGLTLHEMFPGTSVWVALGSGNIPFMNLPADIRRVLVAGDNNAGGRRAAKEACEAFQSQGRRADTIFPADDYEDFNDQLRDIRTRKS